jgi:hypothetical protein
VAGAGRHGGLPLDGELDWSGQKWPETGDCPICENPHELQEPIFLGANFQLEVDFWSIFDQFRWFPEFPSFPFYEFTSFFRFQVPGSTCFLVPMVKVPSEQFKCGRIITPLTGFLAPFWGVNFGPFFGPFGIANLLVLLGFCVPRVVFGPFLDGFLNVYLVAELRWIQRRLSHRFRAADGLRDIAEDVKAFTLEVVFDVTK